MLTDTRDHQEGPTQTARMPAYRRCRLQITEIVAQAEFTLRPNVPGQGCRVWMILRWIRRWQSEGMFGLWHTL